MQAVDFPLEPGERLNCYPHGPATDFGDGLFNACTVPSGGSLEVFSQPANGAIEFFNDGRTWRFTMENPPAINTEDSFTYRVADGQGGFSDPATVRLLMTVEV